MNWSRVYHAAFATRIDASDKIFTLHPSKFLGRYRDLDFTQKILWIIHMFVHFLFFGYSMYWVIAQDTDLRWGVWMVAATMIVVVACECAAGAHRVYLFGPKGKIYSRLQWLCLASLFLGVIFFEILSVRWILNRQIFTFLPEGLTLTAICCIVVYFVTYVLLVPCSVKPKPTN